MRTLRALLSAFGFVLALLACAVVVLIDRNSARPERINFAFVEGTDHGAIRFVEPLSLYTVVGISLAGALVGWILGVVMTRRGWSIARAGHEPPE